MIFTLFVILSSLLISFVLFVAFLHPEKVDNPTIQVSRIDMEKEIDSLFAIELKDKLHKIQGVKNEIIIKDNVIVYFHDNSVTNSKKVFSQFVKTIDCKASMFEIPSHLMSKSVCPVTGENGFVNRISRAVNKIF